MNYKRKTWLKTQSVCKYLEQQQAEHTDVSFHINICQLRFFNRVWNLINGFFFKLRKKKSSDKKWIIDFAFVDLLMNLNELNRNLQKKEKFVYDMFNNRMAFMN